MKECFNVDYILLYQYGIANIIRYRDLKRIRQGTFMECEGFSRGLIEAGKHVAVMHCDMAGDIMCIPIGKWRDGKGDIFGDRKNPPVVGRE